MSGLDDILIYSIEERRQKKADKEYIERLNADWRGLSGISAADLEKVVSSRPEKDANELARDRIQAALGKRSSNTGQSEASDGWSITEAGMEWLKQATPEYIGGLDDQIQEQTGWSTSYYEIPEGAAELGDLIEHKGMNFNVGNIFKAAYRLGDKSGTTELYDLNKIKWFVQREIDRVLNEEEGSDG